MERAVQKRPERKQQSDRETALRAFAEVIAREDRVPVKTVTPEYVDRKLQEHYGRASLPRTATPEEVDRELFASSRRLREGLRLLKQDLSR